MKLAGFDKVGLTGFEDYEVQELNFIKILIMMMTLI